MRWASSSKNPVTRVQTVLEYDEGGHLLGEYSSTGALIQETVWMGDVPVATLRRNGSSVTIYYVHGDHLGTPRKITNGIATCVGSRRCFRALPTGWRGGRAKPTGCVVFESKRMRTELRKCHQERFGGRSASSNGRVVRSLGRILRRSQLLSMG